MNPDKKIGYQGLESGAFDSNGPGTNDPNRMLVDQVFGDVGFQIEEGKEKFNIETDQETVNIDDLSLLPQNLMEALTKSSSEKEWLDIFEKFWGLYGKESLGDHLLTLLTVNLTRDSKCKTFDVEALRAFVEAKNLLMPEAIDAACDKLRGLTNKTRQSKNYR